MLDAVREALTLPRHFSFVRPRIHALAGSPRFMVMKQLEKRQ